MTGKDDGGWIRKPKLKVSAIGHFSKASLLECMRFVIFHKRSRKRSQCISGPISE